MQPSAKIMSRGRSISRDLFALTLAAAAFVACSSTSGGQACSPGDAQGCACPDGSQGLSTCEADAAAYGACACGSDAGIKDAAPSEAASRDAASDAAPDVGTEAQYMQSCIFADGGPGNCAPGLTCFLFPNRGAHCSHSCTQSSDCAPPSPGCNGMGECKAP